jgi:hypothetical protein
MMISVEWIVGWACSVLALGGAAIKSIFWLRDLKDELQQIKDQHLNEISVGIAHLNDRIDHQTDLIVSELRALRTDLLVMNQREARNAKDNY